jgi:hypothetical protein
MLIEKIGEKLLGAWFQYSQRVFLSLLCAFIILLYFNSPPLGWSSFIYSNHHNAQTTTTSHSWEPPFISPIQYFAHSIRYAKNLNMNTNNINDIDSNINFNQASEQLRQFRDLISGQLVISQLLPKNDMNQMGS